jgi:hypothetical protein
VFDDEFPGSATDIKLYGSEKNTQLCAIKYKNGEVRAASFPVSGAPLYAYYGIGPNGTRYANADGSGTIDVKALRSAIKTCVDEAKLTDYYHQPRVEADD